MSITISESEQGSEAWFCERAGLVTASKMAVVMSAASGRAGTMPGRTRYLNNLAAEILTGEPNMEGYKSAAMERGNAMEAHIRRAYALISNKEPKVVGFVKNDGLIKGRELGCSPDSLIGDNEVLEIKSMQPDLLIEQLKANTFPPEHKAQCQGSMWVCDREFCTLAIGYGSMPVYRATIKRDEMYLRTVKDACESFYQDLDRLVEWLRNYK